MSKPQFFYWSGVIAHPTFLILISSLLFCCRPPLSAPACIEVHRKDDHPEDPNTIKLSRCIPAPRVPFSHSLLVPPAQTQHHSLHHTPPAPTPHLTEYTREIYLISNEVFCIHCFHSSDDLDEEKYWKKRKPVWNEKFKKFIFYFLDLEFHFLNSANDTFYIYI